MTLLEITDRQNSIFAQSTGIGSGAFSVSDLELVILLIFFAVFLILSVSALVDLYQAWVTSSGKFALVDAIFWWVYLLVTITALFQVVTW